MGRRYNSKVTHIKGSALAVIGGQWGDEGKGKVVDLISPSFDLVARYQGGHNAGHTVKFGDKHFALRLVPSGICRGGVMNVIGNGLVSGRAHVILPTHALLDGAREKALGDANIGTTSRGIGPAYESKANRSGLRMADLIDPDRFCAIARPVVSHHDAVLKHFYGVEGAPVEETLETYVECGRKLARFVTDTSVFLHHALANGRKLSLI